MFRKIQTEMLSKSHLFVPRRALLFFHRSCFCLVLRFPFCFVAPCFSFRFIPFCFSFRCKVLFCNIAILCFLSMLQCTNSLLRVMFIPPTICDGGTGEINWYHKGISEQQKWAATQIPPDDSLLFCWRLVVGKMATSKLRHESEHTPWN